MPEHRSNTVFSRGLTAVARGRYLEALALFETSMELTRRGGDSPPVKCLSYYALCDARASTRLQEAHDLCAAAVHAEPSDPDHHLNLGRVHLRMGDREQAFESFVRGLRVDRRHRGLIHAVGTIGFRRRPVLAFLGRRHPLNRMLGQLRAGRRRSSLSNVLARI
jgi:tetratricopeptide (TPR) repeat protein